MQNLGRSIIWVVLCLIIASTAFAESTVRLVGRLDTVWGDGAPDSGHGYRKLVHLVTEDGRRLEVEVGAALGGSERWSGRRVAASLTIPEDETKPARVVALQWLASEDEDEGQGGARGGVSGSVPWVTIPCKFGNISAEPRDLAFFSGMYDNVPGGLDHYWREVSYNNIDVVGSIAIDWVTLPEDQTHYVPTPGAGCFGTSEERADLDALFNDCTAAADALVDFANSGSPFQGINLMFNSDLDGCAWGGGRFATLDGVTQVWRTTWEPPWGYANEGVMAHEMGHGMGLPHSNNSDGDGSPYDSPWDVMSAATSYSVSDPVYGALGKHTNTYHKDRLGWIAAGEIFDAPDGVSVITIDQLALPSTSNYRMARIPFDASSYYTVEARDLYGGYDGNLPGNAVIIHEVVPGRNEPAWVVDGDDPPANFADSDGVMWVPGETFEDLDNEIQVRVIEATADGFRVEILNGSVVALIFESGFETGDTSEW